MDASQIANGVNDALFFDSNIINIKHQQNPKNSPKMFQKCCRLYAIVINVLHFCFELRVLKMTSKIKHMIVLFLNEWDLTNFSHTE